MPFKWRLKKTRKYDISTKNVFIVGVYLLDNAYLECTLTADSTGQECLNSIAQRIELTEVSNHVIVALFHSLHLSVHIYLSFVSFVLLIAAVVVIVQTNK